jgi:hypothetical protein
MRSYKRDFFRGILYNRICSGNLFVLIRDSGVHKKFSRKTLSPFVSAADFVSAPSCRSISRDYDYIV